MFLELKGHEVHQAADGIEALQLFVSSEFEIVISDIKMPRMDGVRLIHEIRMLQPRLPVIATTGYTDKVPEGVLVIAKPLNLDDLSQRIDEFLGLT